MAQALKRTPKRTAPMPGKTPAADMSAAESVDGESGDVLVAFQARIEERDGQFCVVDENDADQGCFDTRAEADDKLAQIMGDAQASIATGAAFHVFVTVEGIETNDSRMFEVGSLRPRAPLPAPLMIQDVNSEFGGHAGAWFAGAILTLERDVRDETRWIGTGNLVAGDRGAEAENLIRGGLRGVSVDATYDDVTMDIRVVDTDGFPVDVLYRFDGGTIMGATATPFPAFEQCLIWFDDETEPEMVAATHGGDIPMTSEPEVVDAPELLLLASGGPTSPPADWFTNPALKGEQALHVAPDGRIVGHIATWKTCHVGRADTCVTAPISPSDYAYFHTGEVTTDGGERIAVGQLTLGTGHAAMSENARGAMAHYDDTGSAVADIRVGEDSYGIWCAGAVRPGITGQQIRELCASAPSGDWRRINGALELVAVLCVNVPGFPVPRTNARVASGAETALVAAPGPGVMSWPAQQTGQVEDRTVSELARRIATLEKLLLPSLHASAVARLAALITPPPPPPRPVIHTGVKLADVRHGR